MCCCCSSKSSIAWKVIIFIMWSLPAHLTPPIWLQIIREPERAQLYILVGLVIAASEIASLVLISFVLFPSLLINGPKYFKRSTSSKISPFISISILKKSNRLPKITKMCEEQQPFQWEEGKKRLPTV